MKFKIYKYNKKKIGRINFLKAFYTLPCETDIILKLCKKLEIENASVIITDLSKEHLQQLQQDEKSEIKVSQNLNLGFDIYINNIKECDMPGIIKKHWKVNRNIFLYLKMLKICNPMRYLRNLKHIHWNSLSKIESYCQY